MEYGSLQVGMHPKLVESKYFPDLHASLCVDIRYWLAPRLPKTYSISVERGLIMWDRYGEQKRYRPDVRIDRVESPIANYIDATSVNVPSFTVNVPNQPQRYLAIRGEDEHLITTIEILSPANKNGDGYDDFRRKQEHLSERGVYLVEIDLLIQGKRRWQDKSVNRADYVMTVQRGTSEIANIWAVTLGEALPTFPIPLLLPDADIPLPMENILQAYLTKSGLRERLSQ